MLTGLNDETKILTLEILKEKNAKLFNQLSKAKKAI